jgi:hypothetical protein
MIPESVYALNDGAVIAVYAVLAKHADRDGVCWPSMKKIEESLGWSDTRIRPALKRLIDAGLVVIEHRQLHGMSRANLYRLTANVQVSHSKIAVSHGEVLGISPRDVGYLTTGDELEPIELSPDELNGVNPLPPKPKPKKGSPYADDFEAFWKSYLANDRHGRSDKPKSAKLWAALSEDERVLAMGSVPLFAAGHDWRSGFCPGAQVWLGGRRWENPPMPEMTVSANGTGPRGGFTSEELRRKAEQEERDDAYRDDSDVVDAGGRVVQRADHGGQNQGVSPDV